MLECDAPFSAEEARVVDEGPGMGGLEGADFSFLEGVAKAKISSSSSRPSGVMAGIGFLRLPPMTSFGTTCFSRVLSLSEWFGGVGRCLRCRSSSCSRSIAMTSSNKSRDPSSKSGAGIGFRGGGGTSESLGSLGFLALGFEFVFGVSMAGEDGAGEPLTAMLPTRNLMTGREGTAGVGVGGKGVCTGTEGLSRTTGVVDLCACVGALTGKGPGLG